MISVWFLCTSDASFDFYSTAFFLDAHLFTFYVWRKYMKNGQRPGQRSQPKVKIFFNEYWSAEHEERVRWIFKYPLLCVVMKSAFAMERMCKELAHIKRKDHNRMCEFTIEGMIIRSHPLGKDIRFYADEIEKLLVSAVKNAHSNYIQRLQTQQAADAKKRWKRTMRKRWFRNWNKSDRSCSVRRPLNKLQKALSKKRRRKENRRQRWYIRAMFEEAQNLMEDAQKLEERSTNERRDLARLGSYCNKV